MRAAGWTVILAAMAGASLQATYSYYFTDPFSSISATAWHQNGVASVSSGVGLTSSDANGGSLISLVAPPAGQRTGEIDSTLNIGTTGGTIVHYHNASSDARSGPAASGSYVSAELRNIVFTNGVCSATLIVEQRVSNYVGDLASVPVGCKANSVFRSVLKSSTSVLFLFVDDYFIAGVAVPALSGSPGVGVRNCGTGTGIAQTRFGIEDTTVPGGIPSGTLVATPSSNRVELQWGGAADNPNGVGVAAYFINRSVNPNDVNGPWMNIGRTLTPDFVDETVQPNSTYGYSIFPIDGDMNQGPGTWESITTTAVPTTVARRVGVRPTGAYWGGSPEQIDLFSGNLNITLPLFQAVGRGFTAPFSLSYNSQLWRRDVNGTWNYGGDVGFGYGWRLLLCSITPVYSGLWTIDHYTYTDATGAQYRLDVDENGMWRSREGVYVRYDDDKNRLIFPDGHFFEMDVVSQGQEWDAGTRYPSRMVDTNGNYILFNYMQGLNAPEANSSSRLSSVEDPRECVPGTGCSSYQFPPSYSFTYNKDSPTPHLVSITNSIGTSESYTFQFATISNLVSPFSWSPNYGPTTVLSSVTNSIGQTDAFSYSPGNTGEIVQMTLPYGGILQWGYTAVTNSAGMLQDEVSTRSLTTTPGGTASTVSFVLPSNDSSSMLHAQRTVVDSASDAARSYLFQNDPASPYAGFLTSEQDSNSALAHNYRSITNTWAQDPWGHPYVTETDSTQDPGTQAL